MKYNMYFRVILDIYARVCYIVEYISKNVRGLSKAINERAGEVSKNKKKSLIGRWRTIVNCFTKK